MPIYEYRCSGCRHRFEALVPFAEREGVRCPACDGRVVERLFSSFAVASPDAAAPAPGPCGSSRCACRVPES